MKCLLIVAFKMIDFFPRFVKAELIKLAGMAGVMHQADHAYLYPEHLVIHQLATDVPSIACVIK